MPFSVCMRDCYDTCSILSEFKDGKLSVRGNPEHLITAGFLCPKGALLPKWFHSPDRLKAPLIRTGERGSGEFREASWDEAINFVANKLKETIEEYGSESVLVYQYAGDRGVVNYAFPLRLFHYLNTAMLDYGICDRAGQEALKDVYGTAIGLDPEELKKQRLIVYWGVNPFWTNLHGFMLAKRYGLETWTVDVVRTETAKRSHRFFQIRPETDVLFALGVAKLIIENELYDRDFVRENVYGFEEFKNYVKTLSLDYVVKETGLSREEIEDFAFGFSEKRGVIHMGYGFQRSLSGGEAVRAIAILPALVGHPFGFIYDMKTIDKSYAEGAFLRTKPAKRIAQVKLAEYIEKGEIKFLYIYNSNPLASLPNQRRLRKALKESDVFVVTHDIFLTDTALYSDVVLPANTFFERLDIADSYYHRYVALNEPVARLYGKSNSEVTRLLAKALGIQNPHLHESDEEVIRKILELNGLSWGELKRKGFIRVPEKPRRWKTPSGKIEFYSQRAVERGLSPFPEYRKREGKYPLKLLTPTYRMTITSQYHNTHGMIDPNLYMNPADAEKRGIKDGDDVEVFNDRGRIKTTVKLTEDLPRGVVLLYKAFWVRLLGWNANFLTTDETAEEYGNASAYHSTWVEVRKRAQNSNSSNSL
ncbi:molybdopterin oxidoreductase, molybdopterin-binding subunit [Thermococcus kodakarensis KOD1]|uniref:Molybdopterin oxidoreductase, molybdopterin-binding subunit n=1 Tax=Thermococcus kodakarensis (strain ATCC BAA-918 / JCM 12380 / KOD1) TaxID=69014 RepID=Q5JG42_THEKO|nr:molybdopterin-dependent oxidoreductase [Thermococcus kodakarensis]WCN28722.1 molybdopterin-dependent oxidoreductase [Thermococcus kodakarensis]WCN31019.1 molybdopterin-dependent oxidoreductase [Thermococcus kodakarensis]BAD84879.1 molybdopterin oxidoreductase, molybdopterin-binding subunit [Thermococcus kodakarensis KOD1]